ncbi:hypothetical protein [Brevibacillus porteri]|uniref:Uncharacterized protein n=1 Tax=Brevibacillus porteri TaxID=2126350 RepID=A0ABX5FMS6_9BACL|nr:hypothetical protein [Brevibacillus porteri]MED1802993.1 hypothetical protein [Brevibacillus porteri]MED2134647.1 hypothetical protein [Brevibacillus porteri]MED2748174.1 hypothetical protein [Brevibacillus porteri]MED2817497.1 hypothetical protein [Brevibacillus porteri]MED2897805.1 hypothetical protein [Brevibacillus porteri]
MFGNKTLQQHVDEFLEKVSEREGKIQSKIEELESQLESLMAKVNEQTSAMVELEIAGDDTGAAKILKSNRQMQLQIEEIKYRIQEYQAQFGKTQQYEKSLDKVKAAAIQAKKARSEKMTSLEKQKKELEQQMEELNKKRDQATLDWQVAYYTNVEMSLINLASYIDGRARTLSHSEKESLLRTWIDGESIEKYFRKSQEKQYTGPNITVNNTESTMSYGSEKI